MAMKEVDRTILEEEAPGFILFPDQVAHPMNDLILS